MLPSILVGPYLSLSLLWHCGPHSCTSGGARRFRWNLIHILILILLTLLSICFFLLIIILLSLLLLYYYYPLPVTTTVFAYYHASHDHSIAAVAATSTATTTTITTQLHWLREAVIGKWTVCYLFNSILRIQQLRNGAEVGRSSEEVEATAGQGQNHPIQFITGWCQKHIYILSILGK